MSENYRNHDECCRHHDNDKEKKFEDCECKCVETIARGLKQFRHKNVTVFEKDAFVFGRVKAVINNSVLVLEDGFKYVEGLGYFPFYKIFISICKITEFIPYNYVRADTLLNNLRESGKTPIIEDNVE